MPAQAPLKIVPTSGTTGELREFASGDFVDLAAGGTGATTAAGARTSLGLGSAAVAAILGTVSQSGGVPTGAIIQRGSNANGEFVRYADGTQECWISINVPNSNVAAGGYAQLTGGWTFPAAFVSASVPVVVPAPHGSYASAYRVGFDSTSNTSVPNIYIENGRSATTPTPGSLNLLAKGRWF